MLKKVTKKAVLVGVVILTAVQYLIAFPEQLGICNVAKIPNCEYGLWDSSLRDPIMMLTIALLFLAILVQFFRQEIFVAWRNFAIAWVPLTLLLIFITNDSTGPLPVPDKETISMACSVLFILVSLSILVYKFYRFRGKQ